MSEEQTPRTKPLILIIEDEGLIVRMYSKKLEIDGYDYITADNGKDGYNMAVAQKPDLIMCDVMMPEQDGLTTLKMLKENEETKHIPVVMLSNVSEDKYVEEALESGAATFLIKSELVPAEVVAKIKEVLEASGARSLTTKG